MLSFHLRVDDTSLRSLADVPLAWDAKMEQKLNKKNKIHLQKHKLQERKQLPENSKGDLCTQLLS